MVALSGFTAGTFEGLILTMNRRRPTMARNRLIANHRRAYANDQIELANDARP